MSKEHDKREHAVTEEELEHRRRREGVDDTIRRLAVDNMKSAANEIPAALQRLHAVASDVRREGRVLRHESNRARTSRPGFRRPEIAAKK